MERHPYVMLLVPGCPLSMFCGQQSTNNQLTIHGHVAVLIDDAVLMGAILDDVAVLIDAVLVY